MTKTSTSNVPKREFLASGRKLASLPDIFGGQKKGFEEFVNGYLQQLFEEINPIEDIAGDKLVLSISDVKVEQPQEDVVTCQKKEMTYGGLITGKIKLVNNGSGEVIFNKRVNIGTMPIMTQNGSYIIAGVERVIIHQILKSYGIFFQYSKKNLNYTFLLRPENGVWLEIFNEKSGIIYGRINKSRKFPISALLKCFGLETNESIVETFKDNLEAEDFDYISETLEKDSTTDALDAAVFIYNKMRPGEIIDPENALDYIKSMLLTPGRFSLGRIARRKINAKLGLNKKLSDKSSDLFDLDDIVASIKYLLGLLNEKRGFYVDDIDHLSNRRIKTMGEILYNHLQPVMRKFVKSVKGKLSVLNLEEQPKLTDLVNFRMIDTAIKSFFATSQLSNFLDQENPLSELENKRRITALGPGGLKRETTTFEVRDVHPSQYGRICPISTPEGQNIGLVVYQALYSRINEDGFVETPAVKIGHFVEAKVEALVGKRVAEELDDGKNIIASEGDIIDEKIAKKLIEKFGDKKIPVRAYVTDDVEYISPENDEKCIIADATIELDENNNILQSRVSARHFFDMGIYHINDVTHMDVNPSQIFSVNTSLIPFVDHDEGTRAAMGTNMQRQAVPLLKPSAPLVGTGLEADIASLTYACINAEDDGEVIYVDGNRVKVKYKDLGLKEYELITFKKSNKKTVIHQRAKVELGQKISKGDVLAEGPSVWEGELALGKNLRVAFMPYEGFNTDDSFIINRRLVKDDELTSVHIEVFEIEVADTKLGPEEVTDDIPGLSLTKLKNLGEDGIVRLGAIVAGGDILVGKITPKSEGELTPEEKLIQAIFGDKSKNYKDTSLYMPAGSDGKVVEVIVLDAKKGDSLPAGVRKKIKVYVASTRKIEVGDKLAGRHGNKGVIALVAPEEDMPYTEDGQSIDIILNPIGVISRMNIGQALEMQLGLVAKALGKKFAVPLFSDFQIKDLEKMLKENNLPEEGRFTLYNGKTGEAFENKVTVGYMHILKLIHMVEDKIHARSVGPYSLITQQPLGGKARDGGQRFGEMEVWALEGYGAVYTLQEILTIKSDDVTGRNKTYESIIKGQPINLMGIPESFNLLVFELKALLQNIQPLTSYELEDQHNFRMAKIKELGLKSVVSKDLVKEEVSTSEVDDKHELVENVMQELVEYGEIDESN